MLHEEQIKRIREAVEGGGVEHSQPVAPVPETTKLTISEAARAMGSVRSAKKAASSRANGKNGRPPVYARLVRNDSHKCAQCHMSPRIDRTIARIGSDWYCGPCVKRAGLNVAKENVYVLVKE